LSRIAYVNGRFVPKAEAVVHIEDRGYQFADGVYEVVAVAGGRVTDWDGHLRRLERSLAELRIAAPVGDRALAIVCREVIRRNRLTAGMLYMQITRGVARRDHPFPTGVSPSLVVTARSLDFAAVARRAEAGVGVVTMPDIRWGRCDIKSIALLPNVLAKQAARDQGVYEAWLVDANGHVTEGASTNAWIVDAEGRLVTRPASQAILNGITRQTLIALARRLNYEVLERPFTVAEAQAAREAFITSTTGFLLPVTEIDGKPVANGAPGSISETLLDAYRAHIAEQGL
jgi:D-alanine transaminase